MVSVIGGGSTVGADVNIVFVTLNNVLVSTCRTTVIKFNGGCVTTRFNVSPNLTTAIGTSMLVTTLVNNLLTGQMVGHFKRGQTFVVNVKLYAVKTTTMTVTPDV